MVDFANGAKDESQTLWFLLNSAVSSFSPISFGQSEDLGKYIFKSGAPTILKPFVEAVVNEGHFGGPVAFEQSKFATQKASSSLSFKAPRLVRKYFEWQNEALGGSEYKPETTFGGWADINPDKAWHIFEYFLGAGQFVKRTGEGVRDVVEKIDNSELEVQFNDVPLMRKFYGEPSKYYDFELFKGREEEINQLVREYKDPKARKTDKERYKGIGTLSRALKNFNKALKAIRKAKSRARDIEDYAERQIKIQELMERERKIVMKFNKLYDDVRKEN